MREYGPVLLNLRRWCNAHQPVQHPAHRNRILDNAIIAAGESGPIVLDEHVFATFPDAHWGNARHFVAGNRGVSEWTFTGTRNDGTLVEVTGCDLFTIRDGRSAIKNSYRKNRLAT